MQVDFRLQVVAINQQPNECLVIIFRCEMILQNTKKVVGVSTSKTKARNAAAALMLVDMYQNQDVVKVLNLY